MSLEMSTEYRMPIIPDTLPVFGQGDGLFEAYSETVRAFKAPALIVRGNPALTPIANHELVLHALHEALCAELDPDVQVKPVIGHEKKFKGRQNTGIGDFHNDMAVHDTDETATEESKILLFHTTLQGGGPVFVAWAGTEPELIYADAEGDQYYPNPAEEDMILPDHPHSLLLNGIVDTRLVDRRIYEGVLRKRDTLIQVEGGRRSPWHRFDTDPNFNRPKTQPKRIVRVSYIFGDPAYARG